jgi:superfamily I DNA and/or RNA helicase
VSHERKSTEALELLSALWRRERAAAHAQFVAEREALPLKERVSRGLALKDLEIADTGAALGDRTLLWLVCARPDGFQRFRAGPGQPVRLWREHPEEADAVRGVIARRRRDQLGVMIQGDAPDALSDGELHLDKDDDQATFDRGDRALQEFQDAPRITGRGRLREVLLGEREPEYGEVPAWTPLDTQLNAPQRDAVGLALAAQDVALVHGPPGTGKTRTLVEVIRQLVARGGRVLATAASNTAVDNLAERLVEAQVNAVRLGHPARVSPAMEHRTLDALLEASDGYDLARDWMAQGSQLRLQTEKKWAKRRIDWHEKKQAFSEANRLFRDARKQLEALKTAILEGAEVICATAAGADSVYLGSQTFAAVVLDEATQAPDPIALVAALRADRIVMAGDPCQLPPTVVDREAERDGLGVTIFERLAERWGDRVVRMLEVQHRMHAALMAFPSRTTYDDRLVAAPSVAGHLLADLDVADDPLRPDPLVFVDTAGKGWEEQRAEDDPSTFNPEQAERTAAEVRRLLSRGVAPADVAVITPYDAQVRRLRDLLAPELPAGLEVGTVDGFQGREREAVVVDLVRSNDGAQLGFLRDTRRMNVALTRARRFLLVIGDSATLGEHPYYAAFLQAAEEADGYLSAWNDDAEPLSES